MITGKRLAACIVSVVLTVILSEYAAVGSETEIYGSVTRLHVLANSDSPADQAQKLSVRDAVIAQSGRLEEITDIGILQKEIKAIAEGVCGDMPVTVVRVKEYYNTKSYDGVMFPAGVYDSVKVILGEGDGKNWWCVLFPPLCLSAATAEDALTGAGIDKDDTGVFTDSDNIKYKFRFKILEVFSFLWE